MPIVKIRDGSKPVKGLDVKIQERSGGTVRESYYATVPILLARHIPSAR